MLILTILGGILGIILLYLIVIIFFPVLKVEFQPTSKKITGEMVPDCRENVTFSVNGSTLSAWFYKTVKSEQAPCIVMSHGFCGTKDMGLQQYALKFNNAGFSVLTFDYRYFGDSEGSPRQLYCGPYQVDDLKGAVEYVISRDDVDEKKVILWGTSAGALYGINVAGKDDRIAGVIAQCGSFDHKEDSKAYIEREGMGFFFKLFVHGQRDKGRSRFGLSPHCFPAYGKPGSIAMITAPGAFEGIEKLSGHSLTFKNETCARLSLLPHTEDPLKLACHVKCPVQILVCENDGLVSPRSHIRLVENLKTVVEVKQYPITHFDLYSGEYFDLSTDDQINFVESQIIHNNVRKK